MPFEIVSVYFFCLYRYGFRYQNNTIEAKVLEEVLTNATLQAQFGEIFERIQSNVQGTMLKLRVYYETKSIEDIVESKKYNFSSMVSAIGGAISLYLGASVVAVFELADVIIHYIVYMTGSRK